MTRLAKQSDASAQEAFLRALASLTPADMAILRRVRGKPLGADVAAFDLFRDLYRSLRSKAVLPKRACYSIATLYPWHPALGGHGCIAVQLREASDYDSAHFLALVWAKGAPFEQKLEDAVRHLARSGIAVDWRQLLADLANWYEPGEPVQKHWTETYFNSERVGSCL